VCRAVLLPLELGHLVDGLEKAKSEESVLEKVWIWKDPSASPVGRISTWKTARRHDITGAISLLITLVSSSFVFPA
jgi:hypothetical protein